jgi:excisionase family DNA binding protein
MALNTGTPPYTVEEVAEMLRTTKGVVRSAVKAGRLSAIKVGREYRFTQEALDAFIKGQTR